MTDVSQETSVNPNPPSSQNINITEIANQTDWTRVSLVRENPEDENHRREQEASDNSHKRWRTTILFGVALSALIAVFILAVTIIRNPNASEDDK